MEKDIKVAVIGSGAMGSATAKVIHDSGFKNIMIYGIDQSELSDLSNGINSKYFKDAVLTDHFNTTTILEEAIMGAQVIVLAIPSFVMDGLVPKIVDLVNTDAIFINVAKGFYPGTEVSLHEEINRKSLLNAKIEGVISLIGPSHAEQIAVSAPTYVAMVNEDIELLNKYKPMFNNSYFKTSAVTDVKGAEVGAAYKNILAIMSGYIVGNGYGINTQAALITRGVKEMRIFGKALGANDDTLTGITGLGDLLVTAFSDLSRNYSFGKDFAINGEKALEADRTVEGLHALKVVYNIGIRKKINLPLVYVVYNIFNKGISFNEAKELIWNKSKK